MDLGWKTILGASLLAVGQIFGAAISDFPIQAWIPWMKWASGFFNAAGMIIGAVGISSKVATSSNLNVAAITDLNVRLREAIGKQKIVVQEKEKRVPYIVRQVSPGDIIKIKKSSGEIETILTPDDKEC